MCSRKLIKILGMIHHCAETNDKIHKKHQSMHNITLNKMHTHYPLTPILNSNL